MRPILLEKNQELIEELQDTHFHNQTIEQQQETNESELTEKFNIPELRGIEHLKEGAYSVDIEQTISRMLSAINSMEKQLESVLSLNAHLKKELDDSKDIIAELKKEKQLLEDIIVRMEAEIPSKRELQNDMDLLIAERNHAQHTILNLQSGVEKLKNEVGQYQKRMISLEQDKRDSIMENNYMETKINAITTKYTKSEKEIHVLKGERLAHLEKIMTLEAELNKSLEEKYRLFKELNDAKTEIKKISKKSKS
ncbi:MAG: hypothetical protein HQK77_14865 [Desulfobacterales bacterium]|nr:hypothetical protein [Desulfobacterales bacterium]